MCGVAGIWRPGGAPPGLLRETAQRISDRLAHRGPDAAGLWVDPEAGVALAHRRLSIFDLSERGAQPMHSRCGRHVLSYNGEVYDFRQIRAELEALGDRFEGGSDTEVLLAAIARFGPVEALRRANGMFAFAHWDREARTLHLGRDRLGKKPLYWTWIGDAIVFASELSALRRAPGFEARVDRDALRAYLRFNAVPGAATIFEGVHKLEPGCVRRFDSRTRPRQRGELLPYWSAERAVCAGANDPLPADPVAVEEAL
ncbi:MAG: hypothetical protein OEY14_10170, partial [Myxococcales bacterium]|nr:hypothetical protein [Myxococcales bacterium]